MKNDLGKKKKNEKSLAKVKRVGTFAPALNDKRFGNGGIEKREKGIKKSFFRKALESKKDDYLCTPLNNGKPARER